MNKDIIIEKLKDRIWNNIDQTNSINIDEQIIMLKINIELSNLLIDILKGYFDNE